MRRPSLGIVATSHRPKESPLFGTAGGIRFAAAQHSIQGLKAIAGYINMIDVSRNSANAPTVVDELVTAEGIRALLMSKSSNWHYS